MNSVTHGLDLAHDAANLGLLFLFYDTGVQCYINTRWCCSHRRRIGHDEEFVRRHFLPEVYVYTTAPDRIDFTNHTHSSLKRLSRREPFSANFIVAKILQAPLKRCVNRSSHSLH